MDTKILIKKLHDLFCTENRKDKRYSEIWLTEVDFGGLYHSDKFILNVKASHKIDSCYDEIQEIIKILDKKATEELKYIWRVAVYNSEDQIHCESDDLPVFNTQEMC